MKLLDFLKTDRGTYDPLSVFFAVLTVVTVAVMVIRDLG